MGSILYSIITQQYPHNLSSTNLGSYLSALSLWANNKSPLSLNEATDSKYYIFNEIIEKSTSFRPENRYQDMNTFLYTYKHTLEKF